jgi:hypothetical protein
MESDYPPPPLEEGTREVAEGVGEDAAAAMPPPLEHQEGTREAAEGVGEDAAAAMPPPLEHEEALFTGSPEPVPLEDVERRIAEQKSRIEESSSEEPG